MDELSDPGLEADLDALVEIEQQLAELLPNPENAGLRGRLQALKHVIWERIDRRIPGLRERERGRSAA